MPADSLLHCGAQAHYENYANPQLPDWDTPQMVRDNLHSIIDNWLKNISDEDWKNMLQHYDYVDFDLRFKGWHKQAKLCSCSIITLTQKGCQCGGN